MLSSLKWSSWRVRFVELTQAAKFWPELQPGSRRVNILGALWCGVVRCWQQVWPCPSMDFQAPCCLWPQRATASISASETVTLSAQDKRLLLTPGVLWVNPRPPNFYRKPQMKLLLLNHFFSCSKINEHCHFSAHSVVATRAVTLREILRS